MKNIIFTIVTFILLFSLSTHANEWKLISTQDNINIYSTSSKNGVIPFKASSTLDIPLNEVLDILTDYKSKNKWAPKLDYVKMHKKLGENTFIFSEYYKTPWPATDREFLLKGSVIQTSSRSYELRAHSIKDPLLRSEDHIQADVKFINLKLKSISEYKTSIHFEFHGDMKGWMPLWLMNLIQKKWPMRFIQGLKKYNSGQLR